MDTRMNILVVEDDDGHFALIKRNFHRSGVAFDMFRFVDGQQVLDLFFSGDDSQRQQCSRWLFLLDIRLPKVDGIEILEKLKKSPKLKAIPVVMLTTTTNPDDIRLCYELGCNCYVSKPIDYGKFCEAIQKLALFFALIKIPETEIPVPAHSVA